MDNFIEIHPDEVIKEDDDEAKEHINAPIYGMCVCCG